MAKRQVRKKAVDEGLDNLYISFSNSAEKRKNLLYGIKNSLVMQDEFEKVQLLRSDKATILSEIKKNMTSMNTNYQKLRKLLPNVKNVLSYTEKELSALDEQIALLKSSVQRDKVRIEDAQTFSKDVKQKAGIHEKKKVVKEEVVVAATPKVSEVKAKVPKKTVHKKPLTKLDRIKNNLSVIESKLNGL